MFQGRWGGRLLSEVQTSHLLFIGCRLTPFCFCHKVDNPDKGLYLGLLLYFQPPPDEVMFLSRFLFDSKCRADIHTFGVLNVFYTAKNPFKTLLARCFTTIEEKGDTTFSIKYGFITARSHVQTIPG